MQVKIQTISIDKCKPNIFVSFRVYKLNISPYDVRACGYSLPTAGVFYDVFSYGGIHKSYLLASPPPQPRPRLPRTFTCFRLPISLNRLFLEIPGTPVP